MSTCGSLENSDIQVQGAENGGTSQKGENPVDEGNVGETKSGDIKPAHMDEEPKKEEEEEEKAKLQASTLDDGVNISRIIERLAKEDPQSLAKIYSLMKSNNCLNFYPLLTPYHNIERIVDILIEENYEHENTWCVHCDAVFICQLLYEGFIPVASKQKVCRMVNNETKVVKECLLIPKIHYVRSCMHPSEIHISRKVKKKCKSYYITVDKDFDGVLQGIVEKHGQNWLYPFVQKEFKRIFEEQVTYKNVRMHSVELWCDGFLAAGEIGCTVGSIYTSLTGFQRKNCAGTIQLCALAKLLQHQQFDLWDLGMLLPYKKTIGSKEISMKDFFKMHRVFKHKTAPFRVPFQDKLNCGILINGTEDVRPEVNAEMHSE
ncbi:Leu/Phe-tRNA protein transferase, putative [Plasmodium knowlesi strain H]|uniref:Leu/Phe-tRNA protein transferase, putative n=3 Tax=Plasmodium knowlesi TaxID=5850 RepID=A0A5K1VNI0_PLAKH|nr:arginyl-tRNA--protein transferase, putative [Plasmodium knowlesi strain H]OTN66842.1 putative Leu/Phe-tRNA protein transferase [Plasmodium knowlesi]CAA9986723.1 arginyl-tRNA--protein transferase, putative [Plasmodium knowlesi strain H]SBO23542.1 Leu/Phe-tRNA protein transferase, putative [Plasmodium knowlesi strain H]SBO25058.1 Leu/Phe-tRNA protein transferase, putative [Plasmodium knowlesi strain H]VVS76197.1 arginyl-tRNA--protein transferase, putative [Plasmodium knowlesi strain H]|eukprot:XP_002257908.1 Leu/Phe-tRNA protein transferase, putative [Plasmodium knowlesi strain H]